MLVKIQEQLARVGVEVELRPMEPKAMRQQVVASQFDGFLGGSFDVHWILLVVARGSCRSYSIAAQISPPKPAVRPLRVRFGAGCAGPERGSPRSAGR